MSNIETVAQRFDELYETLSPSFAIAQPLPERTRELVITIVCAILRQSEDVDGQKTEYESRRWQSKVGILLQLIQEHARASIGAEDGPGKLLDAAIKAVNTSPYTGNVDDPHADIATMNVQETLRMAAAAGLVVAGPSAGPDLEELLDT